MSDLRIRAPRRDTRARVKSWLTVGSILATGACAREDITLATLPVRSDGGVADARAGTDANNGTCSRNDQCAITEYCEKSECRADATGTCVPRASACPSDPAPVCGCDGITYLNDCVRQESGVSVRALRQCAAREALLCGDPLGGSCPDGSYCARLLLRGEQCPLNFPVPTDGTPATCWALPSDCDALPRGGDRYMPCGGQPACVDACNAIRMSGGLPFMNVRCNGIP